MPLAGSRMAPAGFGRLHLPLIACRLAKRLERLLEPVRGAKKSGINTGCWLQRLDFKDNLFC